MAIVEKNRWFNLNGQNLSVFMRDIGFDLSVYGSYHEKIRKEVKRATINQAIRSLREQFEDQTNCELNSIRKGVYVIRLARGMSIQYEKSHSPVVYIGMGAVETRIKQHYWFKLFEFMRTLGSVEFDFFVCEPWKRYYRGDDIHKQLEFDLIENFDADFGGLAGSGVPLMNKVGGSDRSLEGFGAWHRKPLNRSNSKTYWILNPGPNSEFVGSLK